DEAREGCRIERASRDGDRLLLTAELPEDADRPVLFIAAPETVQIATPRLVKRNGTEATDSADILEEPAGDAAVGIGYTLTAGGAAVDGEIALPPRKAE